MPARTVRAHFDGEPIRLDEPCILEPQTPLLVIVLPQQHDESEQVDWLQLSQQTLANAYGAEEPEYSLDAITEPNPEYASR
ncbi:MAG: hypothetical protein L0312_05900 [Acidobacteria bacterium]|nr:hypothetical protein [Acidobacteriota bacterium]